MSIIISTVSTPIDMRFVLDAVAAHDMLKLFQACVWVVECEKENRMGKMDVGDTLLEIVASAQRCAFYSAIRQMTMADTDIIIAITPMVHKLLPPGRFTRLSCYSNVTDVVICGIETDCDYEALSDLAKWCSTFERVRFRCAVATIVRGLYKPLIAAISLRVIDASRRPDGSVCTEWGESGDDLAALLPCKLIILKKLVFMLEQDLVYALKNDYAYAEFENIASKLAGWTNELRICRVGSAQDHKQVSSLLHLAWVAMNCRWGLMRKEWITVVIRAGLRKQIMTVRTNSNSAKR